MYTVTYYTNAVSPVQETFNTKKDAIAAMSSEIKDVKASYPKNSGYRKVGSLQEGRISFEHPAYGVDFVVRLEKG